MGVAEQTKEDEDSPQPSPWQSGKYQSKDPWNDDEAPFELVFAEVAKCTVSGKGIDSKHGEYTIDGIYCPLSRRMVLTKICLDIENGTKNWELRLEWDHNKQLFQGKELIFQKASCFTQQLTYDCSIQFVDECIV